jgi:hypothetical protein
VVILYRHIIEGVPTEAAFPEAARFDHDPVKNPKLTGMLERWGKPIEDALKNGGQVIDPEAPALPEPVPVEPILHDKTDKSRD